MRKVVLAKVPYRLCPNCKEKSPYDKRHDYRDADNSDERYHYKECRLCGHKDEYSPRIGKKIKGRMDKAHKFNSLMDELLKR